MSDLFLYGLASYIPGILSLVGVYLYVRLLPANDFGYFSLWLTTVLMASAITATWLRQSTLRYWKEYDSLPKSYRFHSTVFFLMIISCMITSFIACISYPIVNKFLAEEYMRLYLLGILATMLSTITVVHLSFWQADFQPELFAVFRVLASLVTVLVSVGLLFLANSSGPLVLSLGFVAGYGVAAFWGGTKVWLRPTSGPPRWKMIDRDIARRLLSYGLPFIGWFAGTYVLGMADRYILGLLGSISMVGTYSAIYSIVSGMVSFITTPIIMAAHPKIVAAWTSNSSLEAATDVLAGYVRLFAMITLPVLAGLAATGQLVAEVLVPEGYDPDGLVVVLLAIGISISNLSLLGQKGLEMAEQSSRLLGLVTISAVFNVLCNFILIPLIATRGAAVATLLSYLLYCGLVLWKSSPHLAVLMPRGSLGRIGVATLAVFVLAFILSHQMQGFSKITCLGITAFTTIILYCGLLLSLREISAEGMFSGLNALAHSVIGLRRLSRKVDRPLDARVEPKISNKTRHKLP